MSGVAGKRPTKSAKRERPKRLQFLVPPEEIAAIDDFRYRTRMPSKAAAVRELLRRGLAAAKKERT
jgi:hypothetical protein